MKADHGQARPLPILIAEDDSGHAAAILASADPQTRYLGVDASLAHQVIYGVVPTWHIVFLPLFVLLALASAAGMGAWFSALNVKYRDFGYIVPFVVQLGLYVSPVGFSSSVVPERWRLLYALNPMAGVIDGFRWCVLGGVSTIFGWNFLISLAVVVALAISGFVFFRRTERGFADVI